jgi:hypothetical protein
MVRSKHNKAEEAKVKSNQWRKWKNCPSTINLRITLTLIVYYSTVFKI